MGRFNGGLNLHPTTWALGLALEGLLLESLLADALHRLGLRLAN